MITNPENWRPRSLASDWEAAMFTPFPLARTVGELMGLNVFPAVLATSAQMQVMAVEAAEALLKAARHFEDIWRSSIRDRQDTLLEGWADQAGRMLAEANAGVHAIEQEKPEAESPAAPRATASASLAQAA